METLKIVFTDFWPEWDQEDFISPILSEKYNLIIDQRNPDIVFHSIFNRMQETQKYNCKKILYLGENWRPSRFGSDYSISFDPPSETNFRLPLWQVYLLKFPALKSRLIDSKPKWDEFDRFCSFTVSNPSNQTRNSHFDRLNEYKKVHSYGKVRTNTLELQNYSKGKYWRDAKDIFFIKKRHKFMMAYENTSYPYYCTEKLMDAFLVGSLPIYWGDPKVAVDWNNDAFINVGKLGSTWIDAIRTLDQDDKLFQEKYNAPVFKDSQKDKLLNNLGEFKEWIFKIVK